MDELSSRGEVELALLLTIISSAGSALVYAHPLPETMLTFSHDGLGSVPLLRRRLSRRAWAGIEEGCSRAWEG